MTVTEDATQPAEIKARALGPIIETRADLLELWAAWDARPGTQETASAVDVAFGLHASQFGLRGANFRDLCNAWRRAGFDRHEAVTAVEAGLAAVREEMPPHPALRSLVVGFPIVSSRTLTSPPGPRPAPSPQPGD